MHNSFLLFFFVRKTHVSDLLIDRSRGVSLERLYCLPFRCGVSFAVPLYFYLFIYFIYLFFFFLFCFFFLFSFHLSVKFSTECWLCLWLWSFLRISIFKCSQFSLSRSPKLSEILRDIRIATYQIWRIEREKKRKATFHKWICNLTHEVRDILKGLWERWKIASKEKFLLFPTIFGYLLLDFYVKTGTRFSLWDKRSFEISKVERTGVDCISHIRDINRQA